MKIKWIRGHDTIDYTKPNVYFALGTRGSGKSSLLEDIGEQYLRNGSGVFDLFGSRDGEGLAWLRSPWAKDKNILLLRGENVDVQSSFPVKLADQASLADFDKYDVVISTSPFYINVDQEFSYAAKLTDLLYKRLHYKRLVYLLAREAANFYYSRLKVSDNQIYAKSMMAYLIREARHMGIALGLDSIRFYAIDIDIRHLTDYLLLKSQGVQGLSRDLKWLYSYIQAGLIRQMKQNQFLVLSRNGAIGYGISDFPAWHKIEKEDILNEVGCKVSYGEMMEIGQNKGTFKTVGDLEHCNFIRLYIEENLSMEKIRLRVSRSAKTIHDHIMLHNNTVARTGFCPACKRANGKYFDRRAERIELAAL